MNGLATKILAGIVTTLIAAGVIGIWDMRSAVSSLVATVAGHEQRLMRVEAIIDRTYIRPKPGD